MAFSIVRILSHIFILSAFSMVFAKPQFEFDTETEDDEDSKPVPKRVQLMASPETKWNPFDESVFARTPGDCGPKVVDPDPEPTYEMKGVLDGITDAIKIIKETDGLLIGFMKKTNEGFSQFFELIKNGEDLLKLFGLDKKNHAILVDNVCPGCDLWIRCWSAKFKTAWFELEEEGFIIRFTTRSPTWAHGIGAWACEFEDRKTGRKRTFDVYGGTSKAKYEWNLYRIKNNKINRIDYETKRVDGKFPPVYW